MTSDLGPAGTGQIPILPARIAGILRRRRVRLILAAAVLALLLAGIDAGQVGGILRGFDPALGLAMAGLFLVALAVFALRWWLIATALGVQAPYREFLGGLWISQFAGEFGPPLLVGELARFHALSGRGDPWPRAASQALDRWSGQVVLWLLAVALLPWYLAWFEATSLARLAGFGLLLALALAVALVAALRLAPVLRAGDAAKILNPLRSPRHYALSLLVQGLLSANLVLAALGLGLAGDWPTLFLLGPLVLLGVGSLPSLVSDWGKREAAAMLVLAPAGLAPEQSLAVALVYGVAQFAAALPGGLLWVLAARRELP